MTETLLEATTVDGRTDERGDVEGAASVRVVTTVAAASESDPLSMAPLCDVVDPDALDRLVDAEIEGHVGFEYAGHEVTVHGDGTVVVDGRSEEGR